MSLDGYKNQGKSNCDICGGGGLLDDGDYCAMLVPCICTGRADPEIIAKLRINYPEAIYVKADLIVALIIGSCRLEGMSFDREFRDKLVRLTAKELENHGKIDL